MQATMEVALPVLAGSVDCTGQHQAAAASDGKHTGQRLSMRRPCSLDTVTKFCVHTLERGAAPGI